MIRAVREAVGGDCPLMIDANNGYNLNLTKRVLAETAYLGSARETTFETELGPIFVVCADQGSAIEVGDAVSLDLAAHGHSVLSDPPV